MTKEKKIEYIRLRDLVDCAHADEQTTAIGNQFTVLTDHGSIPDNEWMQPFQPYRSKEWRLIRVWRGTCRYRINLKEYEMRRNTLNILPPGTLVMKEHESADHTSEIISIDDLDGLTERVPAWKAPVWNTDEGTGLRLHRYFDLALHLAKANQTPIKSLQHISLALAEDMLADYEHHKSSVSSTDSYTEKDLYERFLSMLNRLGTAKHDIKFYADRLLVTPNYLSRVVKNVSGKTVGEWINLLLIMESKMLLLHSNLTVKEISYKLNFPEDSLFCTFFKREVGVSPLTFKKQLQQHKG
ncbi:MAG: helix-turn-helix domain-containing protein [Prevotella sp.]